MPDVFISHATEDAPFANFLFRHLQQERLEVFLASASLAPGEKWMPSILENLRQSKWMLCLASRAACDSPWVMQEMGVAIGHGKKMIPIIWDLPPSALPGWMQQYQPVNLANASQDQVMIKLFQMTSTIKQDKDAQQKALLIGGLLLLGLAIFGKG